MGSLQAQAQFERARWRLRLLLPLWALQLILTLSMTGLFAWRLGDSLKHYAERDSAGEVPTLEVVWEATIAGLSVVSTTCTFFEIARFVAESLTPWTVLFTHVIKLTCAIAMLVLDIVAHTHGIDSNYPMVGLGIDVAQLCTAAALAIYAILTYRRLAAQGDYPQHVGVKGYGFNDHLHRDSSYSSRLSFRRPTLEKRISSASSRLSLGSTRHEQEVVHLEPMERRMSYNHERDTRFDDYLARRSSMDTTKGDVERAMGTEFGWHSPPGDGKDDTVVTMGVVKSRTRGMSMPRAPSLAGDHMLVSVPEEEDSATNKAAQDAKDREALLGSDRRHSDEVDGVRVPQEVDLVEPKWRRE